MSAPRSPSYFSRLVSTPADRGAPPPLLPPRLLFRPAAPLVPGMEAAPGGPAIGAASRAPRPPARPVLDRLPAGEDAASYDDGGRQGGGPQPPHESAEGGDYLIVSFAQQCREDVLADLLAPEMVPAVAAGVVRGIEIHPVLVRAARHVVLAPADPMTRQQETSLEAVGIDDRLGEVDRRLRAAHAAELPA